MIGIPDTLVTFLLQQMPVIVFLGLVLWFLYKETAKSLTKKDSIIASKDAQLISLSEKALKVATLWDVKSELNTKEHEDLQGTITEIRDDVKFIRAQSK